MNGRLNEFLVSAGLLSFRCHSRLGSLDGDRLSHRRNSFESEVWCSRGFLQRESESIEPHSRNVPFDIRERPLFQLRGTVRPAQLDRSVAICRT